jgi:dihydrodipicolinate synthase/N-acetylneuraminate lyase
MLFHMTFAGVLPILPTPFHDDETLDLDSWRRLLEFMVGLGVDGITILGALGESNRLSDQERERLIEVAVETLKQRIPIIVGTSHSGTHAAAYLSRRAQDLGASEVMVTPAKRRSRATIAFWSSIAVSARRSPSPSCCRIIPLRPTSISPPI